MVDQDALALEPMLELLRSLVALPSVAGDEAALEPAAAALADMLRAMGLKTSVHPTEGAPIIIAHTPGEHRRRLVFYDHYDVTAPGPWRDWHHEPFTLAERDGRLYGRGVASDKGNLAARLAAVQSLMAADALPVGVTFLIEGDALSGSAHLPNLIADQAGQIQAELVIGHSGLLDPAAMPYVYGGVRGRLSVMLQAQGAKEPLPAEYASIVPNPAWRLIWALCQVKNDSEEIVIEDFYDAVAPPGREANALVRNLVIDGPARLETWGLSEFLFGMSAATLARAETFSPTCNVSLINAGHGQMPLIPDQAAALIDFTLVPEQRPNEIVRLLGKHLEEKGFGDLVISTVAGAYPPATTALSSPALALVARAVEEHYGQPPQVASLAPFPQPLHLFTAGMNVPALPLGIIHPRASLRSANEWIDAAALGRLAGLYRHLITLFAATAEGSLPR